MIKRLKRLLYRILGQDGYLKAMQNSFFLSYDLGLLRNNEVYKYHYFVKKLIREGDTVVDLGANLGYFSRIFARLVGKKGRVISIEPVKPFFAVLKNSLKNYPQATLYNYALGTEERIIEMAVPRNFGYLRTGLAHVADQSNSQSTDFIFEVEMVRGSALLAGLEKIHYIKCDIEGYEEFVLPEIKNIIRQHLPLVQVETWGSHKAVVMDLMLELNYAVYMLHKQELVKISPTDNSYVGDYLFIPAEKVQQVLRTL